MKSIAAIFFILFGLTCMIGMVRSDDTAIVAACSSGRQLRVVDYMVIEEGNMDRFHDKIRKEISNGWQPFGSFVTSYRSNYYQAMVKYGK